MKRLVLLASLAAFAMPAAVSFAGQDPRVALLEKLDIREKNLIAAVTADPKEARAFYDDAAAAAADPKKLDEVLTIWRAKGILYASKYLNQEQKTNLEATRLKDMIEPAEWRYMMEMLRNMEGGWTKDTLIGWIEDSNVGLAKGDNSKALSTIKTARGKLTNEFKEYTQSDQVAPTLAKYNQIRIRQVQEARTREEARKKAKAKKTALAKVRKEKALDQVRRAAERAELARKSPTTDGAKHDSGRPFTGEKKKETTVPVVVVEETPPDENISEKPNLTLDPSTLAKGDSTLGKAPPPPIFGGDEEELDSMKSGTGGFKTIKKALVGAGIGGIIGLLVGLFTPVGLIVGALAGALIGGVGTYFVSKKAAASA